MTQTKAVSEAQGMPSRIVKRLSDADNVVMPCEYEHVQACKDCPEVREAWTHDFHRYVFV